MSEETSTPPREAREYAFREIAGRREFGEAIAEKDFWVCWSLARLSEVHAREEFPDFTFKGGTSLSKVYNLIDRFSEDIDLSLDRAHPSIQVEPDPMCPDLTKSKKERLITQLRKQVAEFVQGPLLGAIRDRFAESLAGEAKWEVYPDERDETGFTLRFDYPDTFPEPMQSPVPPAVKIEYGISDREPNTQHTVQAYAAEISPEFGDCSTANISVLDVSRTFWEKVTALHEFHHKARSNPEWKADSKARHYYDVLRLSRSSDVDRWIIDTDLLDKVVLYKKAFFRSASSNWEEAKQGSLRIIPSDEGADKLAADYDATREYFFGERPTWDEILDGLRDLETRVNGP